MKKKIIISACIVVIIAVIIAVVLLVCSGKSEKKPFSDLKAEDIAKVTVQVLPPDETVEMTMTEFDELVSVLKEVVIYNEDDSYAEYYGQSAIYTVTLRSGKEITVNAFNPFIIIDGVAYKTEYEPCEKLNKIANELVK